MSGTDVNSDCCSAKASCENPSLSPALKPGSSVKLHGHSGNAIAGRSMENADNAERSHPASYWAKFLVFYCASCFLIGPAKVPATRAMMRTVFLVSIIRLFLVFLIDNPRATNLYKNCVSIIGNMHFCNESL